MTAIDALAATVRERLDAIEDDAVRGYLHAPEIPGYTGWDKKTTAGLPPAVAALVLREVDARRKLVDLLLAEKHHVEDGDCWYTCAAATEEHDGGETCDDTRLGKPCDCGRDARVGAYLELLAQPYQETT